MRVLEIKENNKNDILKEVTYGMEISSRRKLI